MPITRRRRANPPDQPEDNGSNNSHAGDQDNGSEESLPAEQPAGEDASTLPAIDYSQTSPFPPVVPPVSSVNGDNGERQEYTPPIEGGRRTARGEFFRRPPQPPASPSPVPVASQAPVQATHEIALPLGNLLHLAYNPAYTGADEARSALLHKLANESKAGGRARCWNCGSLAIAYDCWDIRNRAFGEVGVAFCEVCGVWSVL